MIHKIKHTFQRAALALFLVSILLLSQVVFPTAAQADPPVENIPSGHGAMVVIQ